MLQMTIDKNRIRQAFSRQAPLYEENAPLQKEVAERLVSTIFPFTFRPLPQGEGWGEGRALDIGIGTGFATKEFLSMFPAVRVFGCDIAWGMLVEAKKTRAILTETDVESLPYKDNTFDLAFSSLAFQWTNLNNSVNEAFRVLKPDGMFYFSTFGEKTLRELIDSYSSAWHSMGMEGTPKTMKFESPKRVKAIMESAGFKDVEVKTDPIKNSYRSPEALLRSLKAIGAGNPSKEFHPSRTLLQKAFRIYEERYGSEKGVSATFEVVYAWGVKI